jgi:hypothetical protein
MPDYPEAAPAILTDIRLYSTDVQAFTEGGTKDLVVRTVFEPSTATCSVSVHVGDVPGGGMGRLVAHRVIFTGSPAPAPEMKPETALTPAQIDRMVACEEYPHADLIECGKCGYVRPIGRES